MGQPNRADEPQPPPSSASVALVTSDPPTAPSPKVRVPRSKRKFGISLYHAWCKRCSICGAFCPTEALINDELGTPLVVDEDKCNGCLQCMHRCPDFCVEVYEKTPLDSANGTQQGQADRGADDDDA
jgi:2-oxoglutarate ferredoxin oxidoreductase subunit delta